MLTIVATLLLNYSGYTQDKGCLEGDCHSGWGVYTYYIGDIYQGRYQGYFKDGQRNGKGKFVYANLSKYEGSWFNGKPQGAGAKTSKEGHVQSGIWSGGKLIKEYTQQRQLNCLVGDCKDGYGKSKDNLGNTYSGAFASGQYQGYGEMRYFNGDKYKGYWKQHQQHGQGSYFFNNGHVNTGKFLAGQFASNKMKVWALIVGVGDYLKFSPLKFTTQDARTVYGFLRSVEGGAVPENQIKLLLDKEATAYNITNTAADLFEQADSNDLILFYFAGHGKNGAFLPYDFDGNQGNLLHHGLVNSLLKDSPAKYKLCVVDACHSGSFDLDYSISYEDYLESYHKSGAETITSSTRSSRDIRDRIKAYYASFEGIKGGLALILSSASEEISLEANKLEQGVFSYYFVQALKGAANTADVTGTKDKIIDINEIFRYVEKNVRKFTFGFQHPQIYGEYDEKMPISVTKH
jgi:hypothetical protein